MNPCNVCILSETPDGLERMLVNHPACALVTSTSDPAKAHHLLRSARIDLLILSDILRGCDGLSFLDQLARMHAATPPRVLYINHFPNKHLSSLAKRRGADAVIDAPYNADLLLQAMNTVLQQSIPALAEKTFSKRQDLADTLLESIGTKSTLVGREYIAYGAAILSCTMRNDLSFKNWLYPCIADFFSVSVASVERSIRTAIEATWLKGNIESIQTLFGYSVDAEKGKPTNAEFLYMLSNHIRQRFAASTSSI